MKIPHLLLCTLLPFFASSQDTATIKDLFKVKHQFEFRLSHGFTRPEITPGPGPFKAYPISGRVLGGAFSYGYNYSERFGIFTQLKLGAYPLILGIPPTPFSPGIDSKQYFHYANYAPFAELLLKLTSRQFLNEKLVITTAGGFGLKILPAGSYSSGFSSSLSNSESIYEFEIDHGPKPFVMLNPGIHYRMKNHDLLGLQLTYYHSFTDILSGEYFLATGSPGFSYGKFRVKGHEISLGLSYTFTGYEKYKRKLELSAADTLSRRAIRRKIKSEYFERRLGRNPAIRIYVAGMGDRSKAEHAGLPITSSILATAGAGMDFSYDFKPNLFWEAGINFHEYFSGIGIDYKNIRSSFGSNAFQAMQLSAGAGYIFRTRNLFPRLHVSAGVAAGFIMDGNGTGASGSFSSMSRNGSDSIVTLGNNFILRTVFPMVYLGARKDIRIRGRLFFSPSARYHQGFLKVHETRISYTTTELAPGYRQTSVFMRGSYMMYSLGLKFEL
jgi:hypothetical protein